MGERGGSTFCFLFRRKSSHFSFLYSVLSALMGTRLPGTGAIYLSQTINFKAPLFVGETMTARATVASLDVKFTRSFFLFVCGLRGSHEAHVGLGVSFTH
jgi:3-hydroxybutyryl-CoA dehydratase